MTTTSPARHRGRTDWIGHARTVAGFALWGAFTLAAAAILAGYHDTWVIVLVIIMLIVGALAVFARRVAIAGQRLADAIDALLERPADR